MKGSSLLYLLLKIFGMGVGKNERGHGILVMAAVRSKAGGVRRPECEFLEAQDQFCPILYSHT